MSRLLAERVVAHRGYRGRFPENTQRSIQAAIDAGAKHIEFDIQMNADLDLVVIHDDNFLRTAQSPRSIYEVGSVETRSYSVHEPDRFGEAFYPERVWLLSDLLDYCHSYKDITLHIDVRRESMAYWGRMAVMDRLIVALEGFPNDVFIISFDHLAVAYCLNKSEWPCGWILKKYDAEHFALADQLKPHMMICNRSKIPQEGLLHQGQWLWMLYGIESADEVKKLNDRGIDLFETDHIGEVVSDLRNSR